VNTHVAGEIFRHKEGIPDPKTHYLFPFHHALALANHEVQEELQ